MKHQIQLVEVHRLVCHERVNRAHVLKIERLLRNQGVIRRPIVVDCESMVILDGHHRFHALKAMGAKRVPVAFVRYMDAGVRVYLRRRNLLMRLIKQAVIGSACSGTTFPSKTTRHLITNRPVMKAISIANLKK